MSMIHAITRSILVLFLLPSSAFAQIEIPARAMTLMGRIYTVVLNPLISLLFGLAFAYFVWGVVKYVWSAEQEASREEGRRAIVWGLIGMFIMFSVFGILRLVTGSIGADANALSNI